MSKYLKTLKVNPQNPRTISKQAFESLKDKLRRIPQGLDANKIVHKNGIIMAGNQRFRALQELAKEGFVVKDDYFVDASDWTDEQIREYVITSNVSDGEWDFDILTSLWSAEELNAYGLKNIQEFADAEKHIPKNSPTIEFSAISFTHIENLMVAISEELADKLLKEMVEYKKENGSYDGFWEQNLL